VAKLFGAEMQRFRFRNRSAVALLPPQISERNRLVRRADMAGDQEQSERKILPEILYKIVLVNGDEIRHDAHVT
jgi:hypothetical protein